MGKTNCFDLQIDKTDLRPFKMACNIYIAKTLKIGWAYIPTKIDKGQGGENQPVFTNKKNLRTCIRRAHVTLQFYYCEICLYLISDSAM